MFLHDMIVAKEKPIETVYVWIWMYELKKGDKKQS